MTSQAPIATRLNTLLTHAVLVAEFALLFTLPHLVAHSTFWALLLLPFLWLTVVHWALIHEAIHKNLHSDKTTNEHLGRALSISLGAAFPILRFGHLMHHQLNRSLNSEYVRTRDLKTQLRYYWNLFAGVYAVEVTTTFMLAFLPDRITKRLAHSHFFPDHAAAADAGNRFFFHRDNISTVRSDAACIILLYGLAFYAAGSDWPMIVALLAARALAISFNDNLYHYATPADNSRAGKEVTLPRPVELALLNANYHETHHLNPLVPWHHLPSTSRMQARARDGSYIDHALMQFEGPRIISA